MQAAACDRTQRQQCLLVLMRTCLAVDAQGVLTAHFLESLPQLGGALHICQYQGDCLPALRGPLLSVPPTHVFGQ